MRKDKAKNSADRDCDSRIKARMRMSRSPKPPVDFNTATREKLIEELRMHQIQVEMQSEELKSAQLSIKALGDRYIDLYDFAPIGYFTFNRDALILEANLVGAQLLGVERKDLINRRFREFVAAASIDQWDRSFTSVYQWGVKQGCDLLLGKADGSVFYAHLECIRVNLPQGENRPGEFAVRAVVSDVSERKRSEEVMAKNDNKFRILFGGAQDAVMIIEPPSWRFTFGNDSAVKMFAAKDEKEFISYEPWALSPKRQPDGSVSRVKAKEMIEIAMRDGANFFEWTHKRLNGEEFPATVLLTRMSLSGKTMLQAAVRDNTEQKATEEKLRRSEQELQKDKLLLEQKNLAVKELIEHAERAKNITKEDIAINVEELIMPILRRLEIKGVSPQYIKLFKQHLEELTSAFGRRITQRSARLTSREIQICDMVRSGLTSKDISQLLNVSSQTIEKHRKNIRRKLGLANKKANLASYLHKI